MLKAIAYAAAIAAAVFLLSDKANAQTKVDHNFAGAPIAVGVHVGSVHSNSRMEDGRRWNNANPGLYLRYGNWVGGGYYNSLYKPSLYVAYVYPLGEHFDVAVGAVTGYNRYPIVPLVSPSFHWPLFKGAEGRLNVMPGVGKGSAWALHFSMEYRLN